MTECSSIPDVEAHGGSIVGQDLTECSSIPGITSHGGSFGSQVLTEGSAMPDVVPHGRSTKAIDKAGGGGKIRTAAKSKSKQVLVADERMYASTSGDRKRRNELKNREQIQEMAIDNVNSGSSEQPESIEPAAQVAGTVDSQDRSGLVM